MTEVKGTPSLNDLIKHCGDNGTLLQDLDEYMKSSCKVLKEIRLPSGKKQGWAVKYSTKGKLLCQAFAENNAFTAHCPVPEKVMDIVHDELSEYTKYVWTETTLRCGVGHMSIRVLNDEHLQDLKKILRAKLTVHLEVN